MNTQTLPTRHKSFSLARVSAIASNTLLELVRQKVFYFLLIFALVLIGASFFFADFLRPDLSLRTLKDVCLGGAMTIFTWLLGVLSTALLLPKDIEDRTLYTILAKPVPRFEYLMGKLLGIISLLAISTIIMSLMFAAVLYIKQQVIISVATHEFQSTDPALLAQVIHDVRAASFNWPLVQGIFVVFWTSAIFATITLLVSTFATSTIFTIFISVAVYLIGHLVPIAREYAESSDAVTFTKFFFKGVAFFFPDMQIFNLSDDIIRGNAIPMETYLHTVGLGGLYIVVYAWLAYLMFAKKEL